MPNPKQKTETTTTSPYGPAEPAIEGIIGAGTDWFNGSKGMQAPMNAYTRQAMDMTRGLAGQPVAGLDQANQYNTNLISNGGWTDDLRQTAGGIQGAMTQANDYYTPFASGQYQEDPRLQAQLDINAKRALNGGATMFGGGRYGSAAIGQGIGSAVADANNGVMLQNNENARNRQLQAIGANAGIQLQGGGLLGQMGEGARSSALQSVSQLPMLNNLGYSGAERMAGLGDYFQSRSQERQDLPFARLGQYAGLIGQMGGMGGTVTKPKGATSAQGAIGGAFAGGGLGAELGKAVPSIGGWGTAIGALGGGLLGSGAF